MNKEQSVKYSENNIFYYFELLKKWKKFIIYNVTIVTIASTIIAFLLPKWYFSFASVKPAENIGQSFFSAILGSKGLSSIGKSFSVGLQYSDLDYYKYLLNSQRITNKMIKKFNLKELYGEDYNFQTIEALLKNSVFEADPTSNTLTIGVYDKDPVKAQKMVKEYLMLLKENLYELKNFENKFNKDFLEKRYLENLSDLEKAEDSLKAFQEKYHVLIPEEQLKASILFSTEMKASKLFLETKLSALKEGLGKDSPLGKSLEAQISTINEKINGLKKQKKSNLNNFLISMDVAPELVQKYARLFREVELQSKLLEFILPVYEEAKMTANKKAPSFIIIDKPILPEYKSKPKRAIIIIVGLLVSLIFSIIFILLKEYLQKQKKLTLE